MTLQFDARKGATKGSVVQSNGGAISGAVSVTVDSTNASYKRDALLALEAIIHVIKQMPWNAATAAPAPLVLSAPQINQYASVGSPLTFTRGTYSGTVTGYTQQWLKGGVPIPGATGTTYTPVSGDNPSNISVKENAVNSGTPSADNISNGTVFATTMSAFGDSITFGQNASVTANRWTSLTATALGMTELNQGVSGTIVQNSPYDGTAGSPQVGNGRSRFVSALLGANTRMRVYFAYGFNDVRLVGGTGPSGAGTGCTRALMISDYKACLNGMIAQGVRPGDIVCVAPYWLSDAGLNSGTTGYNMLTNWGSLSAARSALQQAVADVLAIATEYGCLYVDGYAALASVGAAGVGADNIHPNDTGYAAIASYAEAPSVVNTKPAPTGVTAAKTGAGQMTVSWTPPSIAGLGVTITNYSVEYGRKSDTVAATAFVMGNTATTTGTSQAFTGLSDYWYVARVRANYSDSTSSPWAWFTAGAAIDSRTTDTTLFSYDFSTATVGSNVETVSGMVKAPISTASLTIGGNGSGSLGFNTPDVMGGTASNTTALYSGGAADFPGSGKLFNEQVWSYRSSASGNANTSVMLKGNNASAANGVLALYNDTSFRVFKLTAGALATATGTTTGTVALQAGLDYLVRLEIAAGTQTIYLNNVSIATASEPTGGAWGTESGFRMANTTFLSAAFTGTHIKSMRIGTTV
ncbi:MAG TPA: GDSL-type esterase/lipase family protein [Burkholderiaceae bacterium]